MRWMKWLAGLVVVVLLAGLTIARSIGYFAEDAVYATENGALDGHDPVAFFKEGKPMPGDEHITTEWRGATWRFVTEANRQEFLGAPEKYAPAYGGYCAYAMGNGYTAWGDPQVFSFHEGRLYLNFDAATRDQWLAGKDVLISAAERNWPKSSPGQAAAVLTQRLEKES